ncbi:unnamed protein product [Fraxinus pennsylvanica]|uniref:Protein kinase domain-containing protein n=1 Tax=Fraxinus pennsylvanica TaxID=56036 RepID=A0AAD1ZSG5_9LAMI|nr:unnamed protein product [Fraxinus pennsylvanica]
MSSLRKDEFYEHMRRLGRLSHLNLLPLVAFYYTNVEKLLITKVAEQGSLASHLNGNRSPQQLALDWPTRLKIIKGTAKGLAYLYKEPPNITVPHGHLKSSNVMLNYTHEPLLVDYGLAPVINKKHAQQFMVAYKSPESTQNDSLNRKIDVWNLGILMCCCEWDVEKRWDLNEAVEKIEELKERDWGDDFSSNASEDVYSSRVYY